jgi:hypothetical protein
MKGSGKLTALKGFLLFTSGIYTTRSTGTLVLRFPFFLPNRAAQEATHTHPHEQFDI